MKELNSGDVATQEKAVEKADCLLASLEKKKIGETSINRTVINPNPSCVNRPGVNSTLFFHLYLINACQHLLVISLCDINIVHCVIRSSCEGFSVILTNILFSRMQLMYPVKVQVGLLDTVLMPYLLDIHFRG